MKVMIIDTCGRKKAETVKQTKHLQEAATDHISPSVSWRQSVVSFSTLLGYLRGHFMLRNMHHTIIVEPCKLAFIFPTNTESNACKAAPMRTSETSGPV